MTKEECIKAIQKFYEIEKRSPKYNEGIVPYPLARKYFGGWERLLKEASINSTYYTYNRPRNMNDQELLSWIEGMCDKRNSCWEANFASKNQKGRPMIHYNKGPALLYRVVYKIINGDITSKQQVIHSCDNPICCNPKHLTIGSNRDNAIDSMKKGRHANGYIIEEYVKKKVRPRNLSEKEIIEWIKNNDVIIDSNNCWIWQKETGKDLYSRIKYKSTKYTTHRLLYCFANNINHKEIKGKIIRHLCNNKTCCNPEHLDIGTRRDNAIDVQKTKRKYVIEDEDVHGILEEYILIKNNKNFNKVIYAQEIAKEFDYSIEGILNILKGKVAKDIYNNYFPIT